jgi:hypothetical protein
MFNNNLTYSQVLSEKILYLARISTNNSIIESFKCVASNLTLKYSLMATKHKLVNGGSQYLVVKRQGCPLHEQFTHKQTYI